MGKKAKSAAEAEAHQKAASAANLPHRVRAPEV